MPLLGPSHEVVVRRHDARRDEHVVLEDRVGGDVRIGLDLREGADRRVVLDQRSASHDDVVADRDTLADAWSLTITRAPTVKPGASDDRARRDDRSVAKLRRRKRFALAVASGDSVFDSSPDPMPVAPPEHEWVPRPLPSGAQLLADALLERATVPGEVARGVRATLRGPRQIAGRVGTALAGVGAVAKSGLQTAPDSPFNVRIGPHRRFTWVRGDLSQFKAIKDSSVNSQRCRPRLDRPAAAISRAAGNYDTGASCWKGRSLPVSVRANSSGGALSSRSRRDVGALPVDVRKPAECLRQITKAMEDLKLKIRPVRYEVLTNLAGFAPPTILMPGSDCQARQPLFNLVIHQRARASVPLCLLGAPSAGDYIGRAARLAPGPSAYRRDELRRPSRFRAVADFDVNPGAGEGLSVGPQAD